MDVDNGFYKKVTFEDRFDRKYACWVKNNPKAWKYWKRKNRRSWRRWLDRELDKEKIDDCELM